jgi:hypothetical protein
MSEDFYECFERIARDLIRRDGLDRRAAEDAARQEMRAMPRWKDDPRLTDYAWSSPRPTPILDGTQPVPKRESSRLSRIVALVIFFGGLVEITKVGFRNILAPPAMSDAVNQLFIDIGFLAAIPAVLLIFLFGNLLAARAARFEVEDLTLYPLYFRRSAKGLVLSSERPLGHFIGLTISPRTFENIRTRFVLSAFGGPVAGAIVGGAAFAFVLLSAPPASEVGRGFAIFALFIAGFSLPCSLIALLPWGKYVQGRFSQWGTDSRARRSVALLRLSQALATGIAPADIDPELVRDAIGVRDRSYLQVSANYLACVWATYRRDMEASRSFLESCLEASGSVTNDARASVFSLAARYEGWHREDAARAAYWRALAGISFLRQPREEQLDVEVVLAWARRDYGEAQIHLTQLKQAVEKLPDASRQAWRRKIGDREENMRIRLESA